MHLSERAPALNEDLFQLLIDAVQDCAIYMIDSTGRVVTWNRGARHVKGYAAEEIIGQHFSRFYLPEDLAAGEPEWELRQALDLGRYEGEGWRVRKDGTRFWANVIITPVRDPRGRVRGFAKVTRDLSERKSAEEKLVAERLARAHAESSAERTRALQAMGDVLVAGLEPSRLVVALTERLRTLMHADFASLLLIDPKGQAFEVAASNGFDAPRPVVPWGQGFAGKVAMAREAIAAEDCCATPLSAGEMAAEARSVIGAPLAIGDRVLGVVSLGTREARGFSRDELGLLQLAADRAAFALEQARSRAAIEESEARFRATFEQAAVGIAHVTLDGRFIRANRKFGEIVGCTEADLSRRSLAEVTVPGDEAADAKLMEKLLAGQIDTYSIEKRFVRGDGGFAWVNATVSLVRDPEFAPAYLTYVIEDIRERKRAEQALRESELRFRQLADSMPQMVFSASPDGRIDYRNQRWQEFASSGESAATEDFAELLHPDDRARVAEVWAEAVRSGAPYEVEHRLRDPRGAYRWFLGRAVAARDEDGKVARWFGSITDIDDQKRAQAALEEAVRVRDDFLSIASHELNTPLTPIKLQLATLLRPMSDADPIAVRLRSIERQIDRLAKLVSELLDVSRITSGRMKLELESVDLVEVMRDVIGRFSPESTRTGSRIVLRHPSELVVVCDRMRVDQIASNLVSNAFKFGLGNPIEVELARQDGLVRLEVRDAGIGIALGDQGRIFDRFERAVSNHNFGGFGLGLWIVRQIVEALGGSVTVTSRPSEGTTFTVLLPVDRGPGAGPST